MPGNEGALGDRCNGPEGVVPTPMKEFENVNSMAQVGAGVDGEALAGRVRAAAERMSAGPVLRPWTAPGWSRDVERCNEVALVSFTVDTCPCVSPWTREQSGWAIVSVEQVVELVDVAGVPYLVEAGDVRVNVESGAAGSDIGLSVAEARKLADTIHRAANYAATAAGVDPDEASVQASGRRALAVRRERRALEELAPEHLATFAEPVQTPGTPASGSGTVDAEPVRIYEDDGALDHDVEMVLGDLMADFAARGITSERFRAAASRALKGLAS